MAVNSNKKSIILINIALFCIILGSVCEGSISCISNPVGEIKRVFEASKNGDGFSTNLLCFSSSGESISLGDLNIGYNSSFQCSEETPLCYGDDGFIEVSPDRITARSPIQFKLFIQCQEESCTFYVVNSKDLRGLTSSGDYLSRILESFLFLGILIATWFVFSMYLIFNNPFSKNRKAVSSGQRKIGVTTLVFPIILFLVSIYSIMSDFQAIAIMMLVLNLGYIIVGIFYSYRNKLPTAVPPILIPSYLLFRLLLSYLHIL